MERELDGEKILAGGRVFNMILDLFLMVFMVYPP